MMDVFEEVIIKDVVYQPRNFPKGGVQQAAGNSLLYG
jgi:hypothetical protein